MTSKPNILFIFDINSIFNDFFKNMNQTNRRIYIGSDSNIDNSYNFNSHITNLDLDQINFLSTNIAYCDERIKNLNEIVGEKLNNYELFQWKISIISNCFFDLPFTMKDIIFIPYTYIDQSSKLAQSNHINKKFSQTLIHEAIHIIQRYNQTKWNAYIIKNTQWIISPFNNLEQYSLIYDKKIINPDTNYKYNFLFNDGKQKYFGSMYVNSNNIVNILWCKVVNDGTKNLLYPVDYSINKYEHPYEELAYELAKKLIN